MVKSSVVLMSMAGAVMATAPAEAAKLLNWDFNTNTNQLTFTTDGSVQPNAQLLTNPSRLVVDLPGVTLERSAKRNFGGAIASVRAGQYQGNTARLVVELATGYTFDPQGVRVVGQTDRQWSFQLPSFQRVTPPPAPKPTSINNSNNAALSAFRVTRNGFFVSLNASQAGKPSVRRVSKERIDIDLAGVNLSSNLAGQELLVERFGVKSVTFSQSGTKSSLARLSLSVHPESPNWSVSVSNSGSLVIVPAGDMATARRLDTTPDAQVRLASAPAPTPPPAPQPTQVASRAVRINVPAPLRRIPNTPPPSSNTGRGGQASRNPSTSIPRPPAPTTISTAPQRPSSSTSNSSLPRVPNGRTLVWIDAGHGGRDPGAVGIGGLKETDVVLDISQEVARILERQGAQVRMTRTSERFVSLQGRANLANRADADVFVSIHANAVGGGRTSVNGVETFHYPGSSSGRRLAQDIQSSILQDINMRNRGVKDARFYVLKYTDMPAALVEVGFVTGREDAARLRNPAFRREMAEAIARGILNYIR